MVLTPPTGSRLCAWHHMVHKHSFFTYVSNCLALYTSCYYVSLFTFWSEEMWPIFLGDNLDAVHDITVAYPKNIPQTERHLMLGLFPREIHFHVCRYPVASLPTSSSALESWCRDRWAEKEVRLRDFYSSQPRAFDREGVARVPPCKSELRVSLIKAASLLYWSSFIALCFTGLWLWAPCRLYCLVMVGVYMGQQKLIGGLELLELACHRYWKSMVSNLGENKKMLDEKMQWGRRTGLTGQDESHQWHCGLGCLRWSRSESLRIPFRDPTPHALRRGVTREPPDSMYGYSRESLPFCHTG